MIQTAASWENATAHSLHTLLLLQRSFVRCYPRRLRISYYNLGSPDPILPPAALRYLREEGALLARFLPKDESLVTPGNWV